MPRSTHHAISGRKRRFIAADFTSSAGRPDEWSSHRSSDPSLSDRWPEQGPAMGPVQLCGVGGDLVIMAISTNLLVGVVGIFSVSQAALMGVGAYAFAVTILPGAPFLAFAFALFICAVLNVLTSLPSPCVFWPAITSSSPRSASRSSPWRSSSIGRSMTGGVGGIAGIQAPMILGFDLDEPRRFRSSPRSARRSRRSATSFSCGRAMAGSCTPCG